MMNVMEPLEFPVLNPWRPVEIPGPGEFLFERNPYYYKIDTAGNQLPYIDYIRKSTAEDPEVPARPARRLRSLRLPLKCRYGIAELLAEPRVDPDYRRR